MRALLLLCILLVGMYGNHYEPAYPNFFPVAFASPLGYPPQYVTHGYPSYVTQGYPGYVTYGRPSVVTLL